MYKKKKKKKKFLHLKSGLHLLCKQDIQYVVISFKYNEPWFLKLSDGKNTVPTKQWLDKCYLVSALLETTVKRCYADFKRGHTDTNNAERSGCPKTPKTHFGRS